MRRNVLFFVLALLGMTQAAAQDYEYVPFVREGVKWVYAYLNGDDLYPANPNLEPGQVCLTLEIEGDTIIGGKTYKAMHKYYGESLNESSDTVVIMLREEDKVVYGIVPDGKIYPDCPIGIFSNSEIKSKITHGEEFVLYDFNDPIGFCAAEYYSYREYLDEGLEPYMFTDIIAINGSQRKRHAFNCMGQFCLIEGIGYDGLTDGFTLSYKNAHLTGAPMFFLLYVIENGDVVYRSVSSSPKEDFVPIAREGMKWVNERVTVQNGIETSYYYTYEFKAKPEDDRYYSCLYSQVNSSAVHGDSVISTCRNAGCDLYTIGNKALESVIAAEQNIIAFERDDPSTYCVYAFDQAEISSYNLINYYIAHQIGDVISRDNFKEVEPLIIDDELCRRYAFMGSKVTPWPMWLRVSALTVTTWVTC